MKLLIGTQNRGKLLEYRDLLASLPIEIVGLDDTDLGKLDIEETGITFEENAILKARAYAGASGLVALADDTGLVVDALDGRPGLHSARYGGPGLDDAGRRYKLLGELLEVPEEKRTARFVCVISVATPEKVIFTVEGTCEGHILHEDHIDGTGRGFGYDAIFQPGGHTLSFAQMEPHLKDNISHRGEATRKLIPLLERYFSE